MGHYSEGSFSTLMGLFMESIGKRQVEWIDELVFPEGLEPARKLHLSGDPEGVAACNPVQFFEGQKLVEIMAKRNVVQPDTTGYMAGGGGFEPPLTGPEPVVLPLDDPPVCEAVPLY